MAEAQRISKKEPKPGSEQWNSAGKARTSTIAIGLAAVVVVTIVIAVGYLFWPRFQGPLTQLFSSPSPSSSKARTGPISPDPSPQLPKEEVPLTAASIDLLLDDLEQAVKRKDVNGVLRHIAPDAVILIRMKQGPHQQTAMVTREEYRKALVSEFAFPSANDYARVNTTVSLASDERSAKISFKTTETLLQANREIKVEGDEALIVTMRGDTPVIVSLEKGVPGDST